MKKQIAIFPGTFDPVHFGHIDVIETASKLFESVIWLLGKNSSKKTMFSLKDRMKMLEIVRESKGLSNVEIISFEGLLARFAEHIDSKIIVRSLRSSMDFEFEYHMTLVNRKIVPNLITVYIPACQDYIHISSSAVRELIRNRESLEDYLPQAVCDYIKNETAKQ